MSRNKIFPKSGIESGVLYHISASPVSCQVFSDFYIIRGERTLKYEKAGFPGQAVE